MTKITFGLLLIATCTALLTSGAEATTKSTGGINPTSGLDLGSGR